MTCIHLLTPDGQQHPGVKPLRWKTSNCTNTLGKTAVPRHLHRRFPPPAPSPPIYEQGVRRVVRSAAHVGCAFLPASMCPVAAVVAWLYFVQYSADETGDLMAPYAGYPYPSPYPHPVPNPMSYQTSMRATRCTAAVRGRHCPSYDVSIFPVCNICA